MDDSLGFGSPDGDMLDDSIINPSPLQNDIDLEADGQGEASKEDKSEGEHFSSPFSIYTHSTLLV